LLDFLISLASTPRVYVLTYLAQMYNYLAKKSTITEHAIARLWDAMDRCLQWRGTCVEKSADIAGSKPCSCGCLPTDMCASRRTLQQRRSSTLHH